MNHAYLFEVLCNAREPLLEVCDSENYPNTAVANFIREGEWDIGRLAA